MNYIIPFFFNLFCLPLLFTLTQGNIVEIDSLKLEPLTLLYKYRFVFSDLNSGNDGKNITLEKASVKVDVSFRLNNTNDSLNMFFFIADKETLEWVAAELE